jgi:sulfatase modifying factor 1
MRLSRRTISQGFYLGKYEITQGQWERVMGTRPWEGQDYVQSSPTHPAVYISWEDVQDFIRRLNQASGATIYRLPTEAEWEYGCRGGTTTRWSSGNSEELLKQYAWFDKNAWNVGNKYGHAVGSKRPNPWGLYDMHGNAWEWVQDRYGAYNSESVTDPQGPSSSSHRVIRGGNVNFPLSTCDQRVPTEARRHPSVATLARVY